MRDSPFFEELLPFPTKLRDHEQTITDLETEQQDLRGQMEQVEANAKRWRNVERDEIDPRSIKCSCPPIKSWGPEARAVIDAMVDGVSAQVLAEQLGKKMSTVYSYRGISTEKVGYSGGEQAPAAPCPRLAHAAGANRIRRFPRPL